MKIVMICDFFGDSLEYQENLLLRYYIKDGHDVTVVTSTIESVFDYLADSYDAAKESRTYVLGGASIIRIPFAINVLNRIRAFPSLGDLLDSERPNLIFVHETMGNLPAVVRHIKSHPRCKAVVDCHSDYSNSGTKPLSLLVLHKVIRASLLRRARPYLSRIFPVVPASARFLHEVYGVPYDEMELLPLGADVDLIDEVRSSDLAAMVRGRLGISGDELVIISGGKMNPSKRTELLLDAWPRLARHHAHLVLIGEVEPFYQAYKEELMSRAQGCRNLHFVGWLSPRDVYAHLLAADVAVFPASQSIMWQQAIAAGLPLIVGDVGNQSIEYLNLYDNIVSLPARDINSDAIERAIDAILSDRTRMATMTEGARRVGREELDWNVLVARTLRFCEPEPTGRPAGAPA